MLQPNDVIWDSSELLRNGYTRGRMTRVQQSAKVELVINPKTANAFRPLLGRADE
jgi:hypothetical protein